LVLLCSVALRIVPEGGWLGRLALGLVFGGAAGNLLDRWRGGAVVGFIAVHWRRYPWAAVHVGDSAITVRVVLLAARLRFGRHPGEAGGHAWGLSGGSVPPPVLPRGGRDWWTA